MNCSSAQLHLFKCLIRTETQLQARTEKKTRYNKMQTIQKIQQELQVTQKQGPNVQN
jgi:hypothetical protein